MHGFNHFMGTRYHRGMSVKLKAQPQAPVMIVREIAQLGRIPKYTVVWLDDSKKRHQADFPETDLIAVQG